MTRLIALLVLFFSISVSGQELIRPGTIDPVFKDYVEDFIVRSNGQVTPAHFRYLSVQFKKLEYSEKSHGIIGMCYWGFNFFGRLTPPHIEIDPTYWEYSGVQNRWALLFHEFGHCVLNRQHTATEDDWFIIFLKTIHIRTQREINFVDGCPKSIMNPTDFPEWCIEDHRKQYVKELFANGNPAF
jgi:hypothetical protein